jgi:hypothetical protein
MTFRVIITNINFEQKAHLKRVNAQNVHFLFFY